MLFTTVDRYVNAFLIVQRVMCFLLYLACRASEYYIFL